MTPITTARLILALIAAILFAYGIRNDDSAIRWAGIGLLIAALLLRFVRPREGR